MAIAANRAHMVSLQVGYLCGRFWSANPHLGMRGGHTGLYSLVIWAMVGHMGGGGGGGRSYGWLQRVEVMWVVGGSGVWAAVSGDERSEKEATPHKPRTSKAFLQSAAALPCFGLEQPLGSG